MSRASVLDAVLDVLATSGLAGLSVRTVAAAAGVSPAQVQYHFRSKSELVAAGFDHAGRQLLDELAAAPDGGLAARVARWLPLDEHRERRARVWLAYAAAAAVDEALAAASAATDRELRAWLATQGLTPDAATTLLALVDGVSLQALVLPMHERAELAERVLGPFLSAQVASTS